VTHQKGNSRRRAGTSVRAGYGELIGVKLGSDSAAAANDWAIARSDARLRTASHEGRRPPHRRRYSAQLLASSRRQGRWPIPSARLPAHSARVHTIPAPTVGRNPGRRARRVPPGRGGRSAGWCAYLGPLRRCARVWPMSARASRAWRRCWRVPSGRPQAGHQRAGSAGRRTDRPSDRSRCSGVRSPR